MYLGKIILIVLVIIVDNIVTRKGVHGDSVHIYMYKPALCAEITDMGTLWTRQKIDRT